jgi:hypothetical protein
LNGERVIALAKQVDDEPPLMLALIGFAIPRGRGREREAMARRAGIHVLVVTGDHLTTASAIGRQVARQTVA